MKLISTIEAAKLWNISPRRVSMLAAQGRISGAKLVGNRWLIPKNAEKPADARIKSERTKNNSDYVFPHVLYAISHEHPADSLDNEEKQLYEAYMQYEKGCIEESIMTANNLLNSTSNSYIRLGVYYLLNKAYAIVCSFEKAAIAFQSFFDTYEKMTDTGFEIYLMKKEFESHYDSKSWISKELTLDSSNPHSEFCLAYLSTLLILREVLNYKNDTNIFNSDLHELNLMRLENAGYEFLSIHQHYYLSQLYSAAGDSDSSYFHLRHALNTAVKNQTYTSLAAIIGFVPDSTYTILSEYPEDVQEKFNYLITLTMKSYAKYISFSTGNNLFSSLTNEDYFLISYCLRDYTMQRISEIQNISVQKVKRNMSVLYRKLGVKNKSELITTYISAICNPVYHSDK